MDYDDYSDFDDYDEDFDEFGSVRKLPVKVKKVIKKTPVRTFRTNILQQRQSENVLDYRNTRPVKVSVYLTWNTYWHLATSTPREVENVLQNRGFVVGPVGVDMRDSINSNYIFDISLTVEKQYGSRDIKTSIANALAGVGIPSSIRVLSVSNLTVADLR